MVDRLSSHEIGPFTLHVDQDHMGDFRGQQAMGEGYRGWHYHVESDKYTPIQIILLFEIKLLELGARCIDIEPHHLCVGYINDCPPFYRVFQLGEDKTCVLWIGQMKKLHLEANKPKVYAKCIFKKNDLIEVLKAWNERLEKNECPFYKQALEKYAIVSCDYCTYFDEKTCMIEETRQQIESDMDEHFYQSHPEPQLVTARSLYQPTIDLEPKPSMPQKPLKQLTLISIFPTLVAEENING